MADNNEHKVSVNSSNPPSINSKVGGQSIIQTETKTESSLDSGIDTKTDRGPATEPKSKNDKTEDAMDIDPEDPESEDEAAFTTLELTPIEKNAKRDYIRIMMIIPCRVHSYATAQMLTTGNEMLQAFRKTIALWPFLAGEFKVIKNGNDQDSEVVLTYRREFDWPSIRSLVTYADPIERVARPYSHIYNIPSKKYPLVLTALRDHDPEHANSFAPIALRLTLENGLFFMSFAFSNIIFDGEFITNFFREFLNFSMQTGYTPSQRLNFERNMPEILNSGIDVNSEFPCFDWNKATEVEERTPQSDLAFEIFSLPEGSVHGTWLEVRDEALKFKSKNSPLIQDFIFALFWVLITRVRTESGLIESKGVTRANIMVPGHLAISGRHENDPYYYGNSTVNAVASCNATNLVGRDIVWDDFERPFSSDYRRLACAGILIRKARREINKTYMSKLYGLKQVISPAEDQLACDRALRTHTESVICEDWTNYGAHLEAHFSYLEEDRQPRFVPSMTGLREGTVIILPRKDEEFGDEGWNICVCLTVAELERAKELLQTEGWV
ncbi:trichothecene 3-o-acetyltransferase [Fusarium avenaceum]|nr:trichothecene 3-o-acetyltransferase [Fusarium avenaceum]